MFSFAILSTEFIYFTCNTVSLNCTYLNIVFFCLTKIVNFSSEQMSQYELKVVDLAQPRKLMYLKQSSSSCSSVYSIGVLFCLTLYHVYVKLD